jgi:hypothetical protein
MVSRSILPPLSSVSRLSPPISELALPVRAAPSCLSVNVYFCTPICVSNSAFQVPVTSAACVKQDRAARSAGKKRAVMGVTV